LKVNQLDISQSFLVVNVSHCDTPTFTISSLDVVEEILHLGLNDERRSFKGNKKHFSQRTHSSPAKDRFQTFETADSTPNFAQ
jgi:hypothetical protein